MKHPSVAVPPWVIAMMTGLDRDGKVLGHGYRLELLELLAQGERGVEALARAVDLSVANASQHLQHLRGAGLVTTRRQGQHVLYRLTDDAVVDLLATLRRVAESNLAAVSQLIRGYFESRDSFEAITPDELLRRLRGGGVTVLDVRPHPGANTARAVLSQLRSAPSRVNIWASTAIP